MRHCKRGSVTVQVGKHSTYRKYASVQPSLSPGFKGRAEARRKEGRRMKAEMKSIKYPVIDYKKDNSTAIKAVTLPAAYTAEEANLPEARKVAEEAADILATAAVLNVLRSIKRAEAAAEKASKKYLEALDKKEEKDNLAALEDKRDEKKARVTELRKHLNNFKKQCEKHGVLYDVDFSRVRVDSLAAAWWLMDTPSRICGARFEVDCASDMASHAAEAWEAIQNAAGKQLSEEGLDKLNRFRAEAEAEAERIFPLCGKIHFKNATLINMLSRVHGGICKTSDGAPVEVKNREMSWYIQFFREVVGELYTQAAIPTVKRNKKMIRL